MKQSQRRLVLNVNDTFVEHGIRWQHMEFQFQTISIIRPTYVKCVDCQTIRNVVGLLLSQYNIISMTVYGHVLRMVSPQCSCRTMYVMSTQIMMRR